jgi:5'-nucleotidase
VRVPGRVVLAALNHGVEKLPAAAGQFPQVSGLTMRVDMLAAVGDRVRDVRVAGKPLDLDAAYTMAIPDYVLLGGDGFDMFKGSRVLVDPQAGPLMPTVLEKYVAAAREIAPAVDGRITILK